MSAGWIMTDLRTNDARTCVSGTCGNHILSVNSGVSLHSAVNLADLYLEAVEKQLRETLGNARIDGDAVHLWPCLYLVELVRGLVGAVENELAIVKYDKSGSDAT